MEGKDGGQDGGQKMKKTAFLDCICRHRSLKKGKKRKIKNYDIKLILIVQLVGLRRHPQEQHAHTTPLSEKWIYCLPERDRNVGPIPMATGVGMTYHPGKGCIGLESTAAQYVAYS
jgi:hypothetical protein